MQEAAVCLSPLVTQNLMNQILIHYSKASELLSRWLKFFLPSDYLQYGMETKYLMNQEAPLGCKSTSDALSPLVSEKKGLVLDSKCAFCEARLEKKGFSRQTIKLKTG